jgi:hypothetical protein
MTENFKWYIFVHIMPLLNTIVGERFFTTGNRSLLTASGVHPFFCGRAGDADEKNLFRLLCHAFSLAARSGFCMPFSVPGHNAGCFMDITVQRNFFQCEGSSLLGLHSDWSEEWVLCLVSFKSCKQA